MSATSTHVAPQHRAIDRHLLILEILEVVPNYMTVREIQQKLESREVEYSDRQLQRILNHYQDRFGLESRKRTNFAGRPPVEWARNRQASPPNLQPMDPPTALTFQLATQLIGSILPGPMMRQWENDLRRARVVLGQTGPNAQQLPKKIRVLPRGRGRLPAIIDPKVLTDVYDALLTERRIRVSYGSQSGEQAGLATHELSPLGLVFRFDTFYLVHVCEPKSEQRDPNLVMEWPLHRFRSVQRLETPIRIPPDFDLDAHLERPGFLQNRFLERLTTLGPTIQLELLFTERTARYVRERPFGEDQQFRSQEDGRVLITATAPNNRDVLSELLNFTDDVEILSPEPLRDYFRELAENLCRRYQNDRSTP